MNRKLDPRKPHRILKFKDTYDEDFCWEDHLETRSRRRKSNKTDKKQSIRNKW